MKTLILSLLVLTLASISNAQNVNIPDANFKNALISAGVDINDDGEISYAEAEAITSLAVIEKSISNMTGIEAFVNLVYLDCGWYNQLTSLNISNNTALTYLGCNHNQLTSLDISNNTALTFLSCEFNQLTSLDVSKNTALLGLICSENQLTSLDVSGCNALTELYCYYNPLTNLDVSGCNALTRLDLSVLPSIYHQLTSLDVSGCIALTYLRCWDQQLTSLDVSDCIALEALYCGFNQLTSLDISNNTALTYLDCDDNQLTSLDVSKNTALIGLDCDENQLTSLDVSKNTDLHWLSLQNMPTLYDVCVWELPFPPADKDDYVVDTAGSPNVYFTTDCLTNIQSDYKENSTINIYPNPSDGIINIDIENINNATIEIYDVNGTLIFSKVLNSESEKIDISGFSGGIYLVKVKQDGTVIVGKVLVR
jgi:Leucine-rich repeat (LRR) protein